MNCKTQNELMEILEQSLLAHTQNDTPQTKNAKKRELARLGKVFTRKDAPNKQERLNQEEYTVLNGKKQKEEDYVSMPSKKSKNKKKEVKKSKRTPVDVFALPAPSTVLTSSKFLPERGAQHTSVSCAPMPSVNRWVEKSGADLFVNPKTRRSPLALNFENELATVFAESMRSAAREDRLRTMHHQQSLVFQNCILDQQLKSNCEAPPEGVPFSSSNTFFDHHNYFLMRHHENHLDNQDSDESGIEWQLEVSDPSIDDSCVEWQTKSSKPSIDDSCVEWRPKSNKPSIDDSCVEWQRKLNKTSNGDSWVEWQLALDETSSLNESVKW